MAVNVIWPDIFQYKKNQNAQNMNSRCFRQFPMIFVEKFFRNLSHWYQCDITQAINTQSAYRMGGIALFWPNIFPIMWGNHLKHRHFMFSSNFQLPNALFISLFSFFFSDEWKKKKITYSTKFKPFNRQITTELSSLQLDQFRQIVYDTQRWNSSYFMI